MEIKPQTQIYVFVGITKNAQNQVLFIKRNEEELSDAHEKWELPGGKVNFGETPEEALARETFEETGYHVRPMKLLPGPFVSYWNYPTHTQHTIVLCFECSLIDENNPDITEDHHVSDVRWIDRNSIEKLNTLPGVLHFLQQVDKSS